MLNKQQKRIIDNCFPFAGKVIPVTESQRQCMFTAVEAVLDQQAGTLTDAQWKALSDDIADRRGLKWEWAKIDDDVKLEIRAAWSKILLAQRTPEPAPAQQSTDGDVVELARKIVNRLVTDAIGLQWTRNIADALIAARKKQP